MCVMAVGLVRRAISDDRLHLDQSGLVGARLCFGNRLADGGHVCVAILHGKHLPAVGFVSLAHVLREGQLSVTVNCDVVVVVEGNELSQTKVASIRAGLVGNTLLHASIAHNAVSVVVDQGHPRLVVHRCHVGLSCSQTHGVRNAHTQGARGDLDSIGLKILWVSWSLGPPLAELFDVLNRDALVACKVQKGVLQHAAVTRGENKPVAVHPTGVLRVELHLLGKQDVADRCLAHGRARVPTVGLVHSIDCEETDGIDAVRVHVSADSRGTRRCASSTAASTG
mmetsp:Transcript_70973/g.161208  ORF Transcript_70973/g.161208 Transcript_70973/m.161208 type:complete len:282 (+) Transcript_70973:756-1601(+)